MAYGLYQLVLVVTDTRLQQRIEGPARATVTSLAALGTEITCVVLYAVWATGRPVLLVGVALALAATLPWLLRPTRGVHPPRRGGEFSRIRKGDAV